jgi:uncharacterized alkaline shock family protein YloU
LGKISLVLFILTGYNVFCIYAHIPKKGADFLVKIENSKGMITVSSEVFTNIAGDAAANCFGVKGMGARSKTDGLVHLLRRESMSKGVSVSFDEDGGVSIALHIVVDFGVNIRALSESIMSEVSYKVSKATGVPVKTVDVYVDSMLRT